MPYKSPYLEFEHSELVEEAMKMLGIEWNDALEVMDAFRVDAPEWDIRHYDFDLSEMTEDSHEEDTLRVIKHIFEKHNVTTIRVLK